MHSKDLLVSLIALALSLCTAQEPASAHDSSAHANGKLENSRVTPFMDAINNGGLKNPKIVQAARLLIQGEDDSSNNFATVQRHLKNTPFKTTSEFGEEFSITDSRTNERLIIHAIIGGCDGTDVMSAYVENITPTPSQALIARSMAGKFQGGCDGGDGKTVPVYTELSQLSNGLLAGKYTVRPKGEKPVSGTLTQIGVVSGKEVQFRWEESGGDDGFLRINFDPSYKRFTGQFREGDDDYMPDMTWSGMRLTK